MKTTTKNCRLFVLVQQYQGMNAIYMAHFVQPLAPCAAHKYIVYVFAHAEHIYYGIVCMHSRYARDHKILKLRQRLVCSLMNLPDQKKNGFRVSFFKFIIICMIFVLETSYIQCGREVEQIWQSEKESESKRKTGRVGERTSERESEEKGELQKRIGKIKVRMSFYQCISIIGFSYCCVSNFFFRFCSVVCVCIAANTVFINITLTIII